MKKNTVWYIFCGVLLVVCNTIALCLAKHLTLTYVFGLLSMNWAVMAFFVICIKVAKEREQLALNYPIVSLTAFYSFLCIVSSFICFFNPTILVTPSLLIWIFLTLFWGGVLILLLRHGHQTTLVSAETSEAARMFEYWQQQLMESAQNIEDEGLRNRLNKLAQSIQYLVVSTAPKYEVSNQEISELCDCIYNNAASSDELLKYINELEKIIHQRKAL